MVGPGEAMAVQVESVDLGDLTAGYPVAPVHVSDFPPLGRKFLKGLYSTITQALLVAALLMSSRSFAWADAEWSIELQPGRPPEDVWRVVEQGFDKDILEATLDHLIDLNWAHTRVVAYATLLRHSIYWGAADLNGDGVDEVLVWLGIPGWCGSAGCQTLIFENQDGSWSKVWELWLGRPTLSLCYSRNGPEGYPMTWSITEAVWWTGTKYDGLCYIACEGWGDPYKPTGDEANYSALKLQTRDDLRQRRWCEAGSGN